MLTSNLDKTNTLQIYNDGKFKRLYLMFAINGGAFAIVQLLHKNNTALFGKLTLFHLALGAIIFTILMIVDVWRWSAMMQREFLGELAFSCPGKIILVLLGVLIISAWILAGLFT